MKATANVVRRRRARRAADLKKRSGRNLSRGLFIIAGIVVTLLLLAGTTVALAVGVYIYYARDLPNPDDIVKAHQQFETTILYDRSGKTVLYQVLDPSGGDRQSVALGDIPLDLRNATIVSEDRSFYQNPGFDIRGMLRAVTLAVQGNSIQGASTITQQLVKNVLLAPEGRPLNTPDRKIREIILASEIARRYGKDQILEWYLNNNFYGNLAYGVATAAKVYFGKRVQDLTLGEAAMLAAIPQNPELNPVDAPIAARQRQAVVLDAMVAAGYITTDQATEAKSQVIQVQPNAERYGIIAPHFSLFARQQAEQLLNAAGYDGGRLVLQGGLHIYTTLDLDLQYQAECVTRAYVTRLQGGDPGATPNTSAGTACGAAKYLAAPPGFKLGVQRNITNSSSVAIRPDTGEIMAMVGSLDYYNPAIDGNFNDALALRQPGSAFKPFAYVTAFAQLKYMPATMLLDVPTTFDQGGTPYTPTNEDGKFHGVVSVREALANSYNIPAVQVLSNIGIGQVIKRAHQMGINSINDDVDQYGLSLALGSSEVSVLDMTYAYSVFANNGIMAGTPVQLIRPGYRTLDPVAVLRIEDRDGHTLWQYDQQDKTYQSQNVLPDSLAYLINDILSDNAARLPAFGPNNALQLSRPAAAKTGTTNDARDAWTVGFTPQLSVGTWVGNNNNSPMADDIIGANAAAPIWNAIMEYAHFRDNLPVQAWKRPPTIIQASVCKRSGLLPTPDCPTVKDLFYADANVSTVPITVDTFWRRYQINSRNGLIATGSTQPSLITEKIFFDYPMQARDWARSVGEPLPPTDYDSASASQTSATVASITTPGGLARVRKTVSVVGNINSANVQSYTLAYGVGITPSQWIAISGGDPTTQGQNIVFGKWDTGALDGLYTLRLSLTLKDNVLQLVTVQVTVDNKPPTVKLIAPQPGQSVGPNDNSIALEASATDNVEVDHVEFYHNGTLIDTEKGAPYRTTWKIDGSGVQSFYAIAYDSAGNSAQSDAVQVTTP